MATFLRQAAAVYPDNADVSRQLILLGDTIGKQVREYKQRERLLTIGNALQTGGLSAGMKAAAGEGLLGEALTMQGMLETQKNRAADDAWRRTQAETQQKQWAAGHGLQAAQLKIAQDAAARASAADARQTQLLDYVLKGGAAPGGSAPINAPASWPVAAPGLLTVPNAPAPATPAGISPVVPPSPTAAPAGATSFGGVPRDELALSMMGKGDAAKLLREARKSTPEAIESDVRARKTAEQAVETDLARPVAETRARESIEAISKSATEALRLAQHPGLGAATGPISSRLPTTRDTTANFETDLETLSTRVFVSAINRMRELSKTGGAVGSVTEKEMDKLANSYRNLSLRQGDKNMKANLTSLASDFNDSMRNIAEAYKAQYGKELPFTPLDIPKADSGSSGLDAILKKYLPK